MIPNVLIAMLSRVLALILVCHILMCRQTVFKSGERLYKKPREKASTFSRRDKIKHS
jgi:hypothetical protein